MQGKLGRGRWKLGCTRGGSLKAREAVNSLANACGGLQMAVKFQFCWVLLERWQRRCRGSRGVGRAWREWGGHNACRVSKWGLSGGGQSLDGGRTQAAVAVRAVRAEDPLAEEGTPWQGAGGLGT